MWDGVERHGRVDIVAQTILMPAQETEKIDPEQVDGRF